MNQVDSAVSTAIPSPPNNARPIPKAAIWVTVYHVLLFVICAFVITLLYINKGAAGTVSMGPLGQLPAPAVYSFGFGVIGATLYASRWVIYAVAHQNYYPWKILWQLVVPLHGGVLAVFVVIAVKAGILGVAGVETTNPDIAARYVWFVMALSFMSGFASKIVIERIEDMTRGLFGQMPNSKTTYFGRPDSPKPDTGMTGSQGIQPKDPGVTG
jgi:hypothetical protein